MSKRKRSFKDEGIPSRQKIVKMMITMNNNASNKNTFWLSSKKSIKYEGIPSFSPEHFNWIRNPNPR